MLILSRKIGETMHFPSLGIEVQVVGVHGQRVRIGIEAPRSIGVVRGELLDNPETIQRFGKCQNELHQSTDARDRHARKNRLHTAILGLHLAQRQLEAELVEAGMASLEKAIQLLHELESNEPGQANGQPDRQVRTSIAPSECSEAATSQTNGPEILLVDDDINERSLLSGLLEMDGYNVHTASDGVEALNILNTCRPKFVLLDMQMPNMDGKQTITQIRRRLQLRNLPVFAVSGLTAEEAGITIGDRGINRWFAKPINPAKLIRAIRELCV